MNDNLRILINRLFQIPSMQCYTIEQGYNRAEELINEYNKMSAGGIASYYTIPLALREQFKLETGNDAVNDCNNYGDKFQVADMDYVNWLESKLVRKAGE